MKTSKQGILAALSLLLAAPAPHALAVVDQALQIQGTNLVLSWPSPAGYKQYLIQYRQTLDPSTPWTALTNAYPANSTTRSTYMIFGVVPSPSIVSGGGGTNFGGPPEPMSATPAEPTAPMVARADGAGSIVPLAIYPPGFDLSGFLIYDPAVSDWVAGSAYSRPALSARAPNRPQPLDPQPQDDQGATSGFFRVFHIPNWSFNVTNQTYDGPTFFPVDFADYLERVDSTTVLIGGQPTDYAQFMPFVINGVTNWGVGIYFDRMPNATDTIQLITKVRQTDELSDQTTYITLSNAPAAITTDSLITFTNWADTISSNTYTFKAQTVPNVSWEIDIYDPYDNFVNYQTGYSADGSVSWTWDETDYNGYSRVDDPFFFAYITITGDLGTAAQKASVQTSDADNGAPACCPFTRHSTPVGRLGAASPNGGVPRDTSSTGRWMPPLAGWYPPAGSWVFAYQDNFYNDGTTKYAGADSSYKPALENMQGGPAMCHIAPWEVPLKFGTNYTQQERNDSWQSLGNSWLQSSTTRNLYYFGHGAPDLIGGDISVVDTNSDIIGAKLLPNSEAKLTSQWVKDNVTHNSLWGPIPFRFAFLDGCNTANGGWPAAWGVPNEEKTIDYYNAAHTRPSAFVGWNVKVGGSPDWGTVAKFWQFRSFWMANWAVQDGYPWMDGLADVFEQAREGSDWVTYGQLWGHLVIDGLSDMGFTEFDHRGDW